MNWTIVVVAFLAALSSSRIIETQFQFTLFGVNKGWIYLDKMTVAPGSARVVF